MMNRVKDAIFSRRDRRARRAGIARRVAFRSTDFARTIGSNGAVLARRVGGGTAELARRVGPRRGLIGLAIVAVAVGSGILIARYLRARAEEEHDVEDASEAAMIDESAGVRRRRRMSRAQRKAANAAISH